ncbi:acetylornithine deacetylase (ArgE) [Thioclava sp. SK-1]|uniref:acetylornithine deacetylase n=1 Tax=Thioclava sp. SK-1 TaxID=1889770 RepID=UPI0008250928|nr:acetylornithine deacetylase [Thioclava sp. SK-1]OCX59982.1 acetylornithine deacetylase (ArgE) [Thioclava sp. SK-1]
MTQTYTAAQMLDRLVGFASVVGQPNGHIVDFIREYLTGHDITCHVIAGPEGDRSNLFATIGDGARSGYVLSGHLDVVPAGEPEWQADPFVLRQSGDRLIGRGACDMKGFVAAVLAMAPRLAALDLRAPIHIALSYDEEAGCIGVPHLLSALPDLCAPPLGAIIGEPSGMVPVLAHKGKAALQLVARGQSGHSSRPDLGANAIHALLPALSAAAAQAQDLMSGPNDDRFAPPWSSVQIGTVSGGQAVNIIPDRVCAQLEARAIAGVDPRDLMAPILGACGVTVQAQWLSTYPALALDPTHPLADLTARLSCNAPLGAVSYGTEAGLFQQAGVPAIICGPGDIARAHRPEEYLTLAELEAAAQMVLALGAHLQN